MSESEEVWVKMNKRDWEQFERMMNHNINSIKDIDVPDWMKEKPVAFKKYIEQNRYESVAEVPVPEGGCCRNYNKDKTKGCQFNKYNGDWKDEIVYDCIVLNEPKKHPKENIKHPSCTGEIVCMLKRVKVKE